MQGRCSTSPTKLGILLGRNGISCFFCIFLLPRLGPRAVPAPQWLPAQGPRYALWSWQSQALWLSVGRPCGSQPSPNWVCSRHLVRVHGQCYSGKDRAFEVSLMNDMVEGHNPALLAESTGANWFISGVCCFDKTDFNDTIKWCLIAQQWYLGCSHTSTALFVLAGEQPLSQGSIVKPI